MENRAVSLTVQTPPYTHDEHHSKRGPSRLETGLNTGVAIHVQMTPPETPGSPQSPVDSQPAQALFHNYLRAFYPFDPSVDHASNDSSLLVLASISPGDLILVHSIHANGWADGTVLRSGERGWLPTNYCEVYDHPYLHNLLNSLTQFWDILGASEDATLSAFVRQDYLRGLIAGVRYLLEHAACLHRDAALVQQHTGIRRMRKGLLGDLSTLVQISKTLQETIGEPFSGEVIHYLLDDLMTKAFKVVTRAVGFVDMWSKQVEESKLAGGKQAGIYASSTLPRVPSSLTIDTGASRQPGLEDPVDSAKCFAAASHASHNDEHATGPGAAEVKQESSHTNAYPLSAAHSSRKGSVAHRFPLLQAGRTPGGPSASAQLAVAHDSCISHLAAIIGHYLHSRPCSDLVETTKRLVTACKDILAIADEIYSHDTRQSTLFREARTAFQAMVAELIKTTEDVFGVSDLDDGEVMIVHDQSNRLVAVGTSLVRTAGECVARTRSLIEQVGDLELDGPLGVAARTLPVQEDSTHSPIKDTRAPADDRIRRPMSLEERLSSKMLPPPPRNSRSVPGATAAFDFALEPPAAGPGVSATVTSLHTGLHKALPPAPIQWRSVTLSSQDTSISGARLKGQRSSRTEEVSPTRKASIGVSIAGSADTHRSGTRDSGTSAISKASTRATTPDQSKQPLSPDPALLNSFTSFSSMRSATTEAEIEAETRLLRTTFASELIFNKDGQVTGGSLPALVEQLTMHDCAPDPQYVTAFYLTFRLFTTPRLFAEALIERFDYIGHSNAVGTPVRLRVYNVFKGWLETYWNPEADKDALGDIRYFALHKLKPHLASAGDRLAELTRRVTASYHSGTVAGPLVSGVGKTSMSIGVQHLAGQSTPEPIVTRNQLGALRTATSGGPQCNVLDFDPLELARQFTLITSSIFCCVQPDELLSLGWGKRGTRTARNVRNMCTLNTDLAHVVGDSILAPEDAKKRALLIKHWTKVAMHCLELNNYDSLMAIMCSINSSVVQRLKRTWELVTRKTKARLSELNAVIDYSRNYASLRKRLESPVAPCIPFLGIYLTDLTFLDAGNPRTRELPGTASDHPVIVINFDKYLRMAKVISHLQKFQLPYKLQPVSEMQAWMDAHLQRMRASNGEMVSEFHRRSLYVEPKRIDCRPPKTADGKPSSDVPGLEERPKTGSSGKERFEDFLKHSTFGFKPHAEVPELPPPPRISAEK
ncbi:hypothetical protein LTR08_003435 [Meristemomyces frigidus]|nr:hypothetical protein LTR08_003435 [Meristemomyces frigidus]